MSLVVRVYWCDLGCGFDGVGDGGRVWLLRLILERVFFVVCVGVFGEVIGSEFLCGG